MKKEQELKEAFLAQLERLLYDIPKDEREEAMDYYRSYFEDAGVENEAAVLEELDSPQAVAASIREGLNAAGNMTSFLKNPPQVRESQAQSAGGRQPGNSGQSAVVMFSGSDFQKTEDAASSHNASYGRYRQYDSGNRREPRAGRMDKHAKLVLLIILAVFTSPIWGTAVSGLFGVIGVVIAAVILLGLGSVGGMIGGIVFAVTGLVKICMLSMWQGLSMLGIGMLMIAASGIGIVALLLLCGRLLPWIAGLIAGMFRRLWKWGRSMA